MNEAGAVKLKFSAGAKNGDVAVGISSDPTPRVTELEEVPPVIITRQLFLLRPVKF
jgi:hypothetical protein